MKVLIRRQRDDFFTILYNTVPGDTSLDLSDWWRAHPLCMVGHLGLSKLLGTDINYGHQMKIGQTIEVEFIAIITKGVPQLDGQESSTAAEQ